MLFSVLFFLRKIKRMLQEKQNSSNSQTQSGQLLRSKFIPFQGDDFNFWKRPLLFIAGNIFALSLVSLIVGFLFYNFNVIDKKGATNFVSYSIIFIILVAIIGTELPKYLKKFKNWFACLMGIGFAIAVISANATYIGFLNLFYQPSVNGNESAVRLVIARYPVAAVFIFGLIGPMVEELTYRVGLFGLLSKAPRAIAYVVTALVFAFIHFDYTATDIANEFAMLPTYIIPGVIFSLAYDMYGLPCSYVAHASNNLYAVIAQIIMNQFPELYA